MADPLTLLREYNINNKEFIKTKDNQILLDDLSWPKTASTNFIIFGSGKDGKPRQYYALECLLFLLKNVNLRHPVYVQKAVEESVPFVRRPDRKKLLAYLNGELSTHTSIDKSVLLKLPTQVKHRAVEGVEDPVTKKPRIEVTDTSSKA